VHRTVAGVELGAHVERADPLGAAAATGSTVVQVFLSGPRSWTPPRRRGDEDALAAADVEVFVHAPYLANPASLNPEVRARTRSCLQAQATAAAAVGARGLVVHGGHPTGSGTVRDGIAGWLEVLEGWEPAVPLLVENTAGGSAGVARRFEDFARLYDAIDAAGHHVGVCLDTCHAHAAGEALAGSVDRLVRFAGRVDLVHVNDSRDGFGSARDRHANLGQGTIDVDDIAAVVAAAGAPAVVETPGGHRAQALDLSTLRSRLA
jgi:deoxyribonuclease IV